MALARGGEFTTHVLSEHLRSNAEVIQKFVAVDIDYAREGDAWRVAVSA